jgi:hypothetical protein
LLEFNVAEEGTGKDTVMSEPERTLIGELIFGIQVERGR